MKKISKHDPFDLQTCTGGLSKLFTQFSADLYTFVYYFTFKKELKLYSHIFNHPFDEPVDDPHFFDDINDPVVQHCHKMHEILMLFYQQFNIRNGILAELIEHSEELAIEGGRYAPSMPYTFIRKSYRFVKFSYQRYLEEITNTLYYYCCVLSLNSYLIPLKMRVRLDYSHQGSFRYLNIDDREVAFLIDLIMQLDEEREKFFN